MNTPLAVRIYGIFVGEAKTELEFELVRVFVF